MFTIARKKQWVANLLEISSDVLLALHFPLRYYFSQEKENMAQGNPTVLVFILAHSTP